MRLMLVAAVSLLGPTLQIMISWVVASDFLGQGGSSGAAISCDINLINNRNYM